MKPWVFIAAFNEAKMIEAVLTDVKTIVPASRIIVVDDGSTDATSALAAAQGAHVLSHCLNRGKGAAIRTGTAYAISQGAEMLVHFDADGQHHASDILALCEPLVAGHADIVLGSRFIKERHAYVPFWRKIILKSGTVFTWFFSGIRLTDTHNGLRAFSHKALTTISLTEDRFAYASELLDEVARHSLRYEEVPTSVTYSAYSLLKGQRSSNAFGIAVRLMARRLFLD